MTIIKSREDQLNKMIRNIRIGEGFDVHRLVEKRPLILGGVKISFEKGLAGHSDADVLCHAICDALFGAAALGDIGTHFPDDSDVFKNADSLDLLHQTGLILEGASYRPVNIDSTLIIELPRVADYIFNMRKNIAVSLKLDVMQVSVKATTSEGLGFTGRGDGIAAKAIVQIMEI